MSQALELVIPAKAGIHRAIKLALSFSLNINPTSRKRQPEGFSPSNERRYFHHRGEATTRAAKRFFSLFLFTNIPAFAQDWTPIQTTAPNIEFAIDMNSIERDNDLVIFKERLIYITSDKIDPASGMAIKEKLVKRVMDCAKRTQGMLSGAMRSDTGSLIEMITIDRPQMVMAPIPHSTLAEQELEIVCKKSKEAPSK